MVNEEEAVRPIRITCDIKIKCVAKIYSSYTCDYLFGFFFTKPNRQALAGPSRAREFVLLYVYVL